MTESQSRKRNQSQRIEFYSEIKQYSNDFGGKVQC